KLIVIAPIEGSPAARAGIKSGDQIIAVDGDDVITQTLDKVVKKMRGVPGTKVKITVHREQAKTTVSADAGVAGADKDGGTAEKSGTTLTFEITREVIHVSSVNYKLLDGNIGYIRIKQFQERTHAETMSAAAKLRAEAKGGAI